MAHDCTQEAEEVRSQIWGQPRQVAETLSQNWKDWDLA